MLSSLPPHPSSPPPSSLLLLYLPLSCSFASSPLLLVAHGDSWRADPESRRRRYARAGPGRVDGELATLAGMGGDAGCLAEQTSGRGFAAGSLAARRSSTSARPE